MPEQKGDNITREEIFKLEGQYKSALDRLFFKTGNLLTRYGEIKEENYSLKEEIKDLNNKITELKLQLTKLNSDSVFKEQEISSLKNLLLNSEVGKASGENKENVKSRIKELISRIDVHLDQYESMRGVED